MGLGITELLLACGLILAGAFVQSAVGFGLAVVAAPFLFLIDPALVPGPILFVALWLSLLNTWSNRAGLAFGEMGSALLGRFPGMFLGLWVLTFATQRSLSLLMGVTVLLAVAVSLLPLRLDPTRNRLLGAGFVAGFMGTTTAIGGPPMALLYQHVSGERIRANLSGYFVVGSLTSLLGLAAIGRFGKADLLISLLLLIPAVVGYLLARVALPKINPAHLRPFLLTLCLGAGLMVLADGAFG